MKKHIGFSVLVVTSLGLFLFCGDKGTNGTNDSNPEIRASIVGDWVSTIDLSSISFGQYIINLSIMAIDSSFQLSIVETGQKNNDMIYKHSGTWRIGKRTPGGNDSLILSGTECYIIDSVGGKVTMTKLPEPIARQTVVLDTTLTEDTWIIKLGNLTPFISAIVPTQLQPYISVIAGIDLTFERKKRIFIR